MEEVMIKGVSPPINREMDYDGKTFNDKYFYKVTKNIMIWDKIINICGSDSGHLLKLLVFMNIDNTVNWDKIGVAKSYIPQLKMRFNGYGITKRLKLVGDTKYKYYLNPILSSYGKMIRVELIREFSDINTSLGYSRDNHGKFYDKIR